MGAEVLGAVSGVKTHETCCSEISTTKHYGFDVTKKQVTETVHFPGRLDTRGNQFFATRVIDSKYALRVVYENRKDFSVIITFYPVKRECYDL